MRLDEQSCSSSRGWIPSAIDGPCVSFTASLAVSGVLAGVWVLVDALLVVLKVVVAGLTAVVGDDVAA